jgi:hypothetical protein
MLEHDPRKYAEECLRQAEVAFSQADRLMFIDMAQGWLCMAQREETFVAPPGDPRSNVRQQAS